MGEDTSALLYCPLQDSDCKATFLSVNRAGTAQMGFHFTKPESQSVLKMGQLTNVSETSVVRTVNILRN